MAIDSTSIGGIEEAFFAGSLLSGLLGLFFAFFLIIVLILVGLYVYLGFAYMAIGKKAKISNPELAWIPFVGPGIVAFQASGMHWWPWIFLIGSIIPFVGLPLLVVFWVYIIVWSWKMFEAVGRPGWWAVISLIFPVGLVLVGVAAWGKR